MIRTAAMTATQIQKIQQQQGANPQQVDFVDTTRSSPCTIMYVDELVPCRELVPVRLAGAHVLVLPAAVLIAGDERLVAGLLVLEAGT